MLAGMFENSLVSLLLSADSHYCMKDIQSERPVLHSKNITCCACVSAVVSYQCSKYMVYSARTSFFRKSGNDER